MNAKLIKVCGMRDPENIREAEKLAIDLMGFIFWHKSSRNVSEIPSYLPTRQKRVGVFVDASIEEVAEKTKEYALDLIQLHGKETPDYIQRLRSLCPQRGDRATAIIKALNIADAGDLAQTAQYEGIVDYFLFDTKSKLVGGNGTQFDWSVLQAYQGDTPFILSGGIGPDDAEKVKNFQHPMCAGIDLNSRFETAPALKDIQLLNHFIGRL
ncbi:MAG: phosphoribosylanthranilate isomerase [Prevotella sp.]|nr:phosphoribosylanthranilate isomerase [Prevotella sp.]